MNSFVRIAFSILLVASFSACSSHKKDGVKPSDLTDQNEHSLGVTTDGINNTGRYTRDSLDSDSCLRQRVIYFDFDRSEIKPEFRAQMTCHAAYLRQFPQARVSLEGSTDERGSREYNLGLGERRGNAVQAALVANGASSSQLNVVSYGEERPVCRQHDESCWAKNRRVEIVYTAK
ncbi:MAG: peptidoglycan-associated lipoprotein Pal [Rhodanobacter sp.]|jgi:peptidoglycan-associated lipoprotein|nr:peptidoglycan-associated lipoprotein Pal [Rhodanobacter sp.]